MEHIINSDASLTSGLVSRPKLEVLSRLHNVYRFRCYDRLGRLRWEEEIPNLVTTQGKNDILTQYFKGSSYTATWYIGLVDNAGFSAYNVADTAAQIGGSNGWAESVVYSNSTRVTWSGGTASSGSIDNSASAASFNINNTATIRGGFLISNSTKSGTTGILYGEADFGSSRAVLNGDTLSVTVTLTVS